jgi:hypothetical protein
MRRDLERDRLQPVDEMFHRDLTYAPDNPTITAKRTAFPIALSCSATEA